MKRLELKNKFDAFIKNKKLRYSQERYNVVSEIAGFDSHFHIQELIDKSSKQKISRATVFRTIQLLLEAELLQKTTDLHGHVHYERCFSADEHHDHLVCINCGKEIEFVDHKLEKIQKTICKNHGFKLVNHSLQIWGYCQECQ